MEAGVNYDLEYSATIERFNSDGPGVASGSIIATLMEYPLLAGDANYDGRVDLDDLNLVRNNFGGWGEGNADFACGVGLDDLNAVRNNFGAAIPAPVPEPGSAAILICLSPIAAIYPRIVRRLTVAKQLSIDS